MTQYEALFGDLPMYPTSTRALDPPPTDSEANDHWNAYPKFNSMTSQQHWCTSLKALRLMREPSKAIGPLLMTSSISSLMRHPRKKMPSHTLTPQEEEGLTFVGEGQCHLCHNGPTFPMMPSQYRTSPERMA